MCITLNIHTTSCETRRRVTFEGAHAFTQNYDIYHPLEDPDNCEHYRGSPTRRASMLINGGCTRSHGPCCRIYQRFLCTKDCEEGHTRCMGETIQMHCIIEKGEEARAALDEKINKFFIRGIREQPGALSVEESTTLTTRLHEYLDQGATVRAAVELQTGTDLHTGSTSRLISDGLVQISRDRLDEWHSSRVFWDVYSRDFLVRGEETIERWTIANNSKWLEFFKCPEAVLYDDESSSDDSDDSDEDGNENGDEDKGGDKDEHDSPNSEQSSAASAIHPPPFMGDGWLQSSDSDDDSKEHDYDDEEGSITSQSPEAAKENESVTSEGSEMEIEEGNTINENATMNNDEDGDVEMSDDSDIISAGRRRRYRFQTVFPSPASSSTQEAPSKHQVGTERLAASRFVVETSTPRSLQNGFEEWAAEAGTSANNQLPHNQRAFNTWASEAGASTNAQLPQNQEAFDTWAADAGATTHSHLPDNQEAFDSWTGDAGVTAHAQLLEKQNLFALNAQQLENIVPPPIVRQAARIQPVAKSLSVTVAAPPAPRRSARQAQAQNTQPKKEAPQLSPKRKRSATDENIEERPSQRLKSSPEEPEEPKEPIPRRPKSQFQPVSHKDRPRRRRTWQERLAEDHPAELIISSERVSRDATGRTHADGKGGHREKTVQEMQEGEERVRRARAEHRREARNMLAADRKRLWN